MNQNPRIELQDSIAHVCHKLSEGNPGALSVCVGLIKNGLAIDPQGMLGGLNNLLSLDDMEIYGSRIWRLAQYVCGGRTDNVVLLLRADQLGITSRSDIFRAIESNDAEAFDFEDLASKVKEQIVEFNWPYDAESGNDQS